MSRFVGPPASGVPELFDALLHPEALTDTDVESLLFFGTVGALLVAPRTPRDARPAHVLEAFRSTVREQIPRLERKGIRAYAALGVDPRAIPRRGLSEVLGALPAAANHVKVTLIGPIGLHRGGPAEEEAFSEQLEIARRLKLRVLVHTPARDKPKHTRRALSLVRESGFPPAQVCVGHADTATVRLILECGHHAQLTVRPGGLRAERAVELVQKLGSQRLVLASDSGEGSSDLTALARCASLMAKQGLSEDVIDRVCHTNAREFFRARAG